MKIGNYVVSKKMIVAGVLSVLLVLGFSFEDSRQIIMEAIQFLGEIE